MDRRRSGAPAPSSFPARFLAAGLAALAVALAAPAARADDGAEKAPAKTPAAGAKAPAPAKKPAAQKKPKLAFFGLRGLADVDQKSAKAVSDYILSELTNANVYRVLSPDDVKAVLSLQAQQQLLGCHEDSACLAQIAGSLGADRLLEGSLSRIGSSILVSLSLLDATTSKALARPSWRIHTSGSLEPVLDKVPAMIAKLVASDPAVGAKTPKAKKVAASGAGHHRTHTPAPDPQHLTLGLYLGGGSTTQVIKGTAIVGAFVLARFGIVDVFGAFTANKQFEVLSGISPRTTVRLDVRLHILRPFYVELFGHPTDEQVYVGLGGAWSPNGGGQTIAGGRGVAGIDWRIRAGDHDRWSVLTEISVGLFPDPASKGLGGALLISLGFGYSFL